MNEIEQHDLTWSDRLQDLIDGDVLSSERSTIESHIAICARCRSQYSQLKSVDGRLFAKLDRPRLDASFDRQLFARIDALDAHAREQARRRADRELQQNLQALSRGWRRGLAFLIGGAIAGIALAFAIMAWADAAGIANKLLGAASVAGLAHAELLRPLVAATIGAAIGCGVSKWLAHTLE